MIDIYLVWETDEQRTPSSYVLRALYDELTDAEISASKLWANRTEKDNRFCITIGKRNRINIGAYATHVWFSTCLTD